MDQNEHDHEDALAAFFQAAKSETPVPSKDLHARIISDAQRMCETSPRKKRPLWMTGFITNLKNVGSFPSALGLTASLVIGIYLGFSAPDWSEPFATLLQIDAFDDLDIVDPIIAMDVNLEDT